MEQIPNRDSEQVKMRLRDTESELQRAESNLNEKVKSSANLPGDEVEMAQSLIRMATEKVQRLKDKVTALEKELEDLEEGN